MSIFDEIFALDNFKLMERIIQILQRTQFGALATMENGEPRVRPFQYQFESQDGLYFCTTRNKQVLKQLKDFPFAEYCAYDKTLSYIRIRGNVTLKDDLSLKLKVMKLNPYYNDTYGLDNAGQLVLFSMDHGKAFLGKFGTYPPEQIEF